MKIALIGLTGSGKTTLFAALAARDDVTPGHVIHEPLVATVPLPDARMEVLREHFSPKKFTPASLAIEDYPGFPRKESEDGRARYVAAIREADAFAVVLCAFEQPGVDTPPDPARDRDILLEELALADLVLVERRIEKLTKDIKRPTKSRDDDLKELAVLERIHPALYDGKTISEVEMSDEERRLLRGFAFLSAKPRLLVVNHAEGADPAAYADLAASSHGVIALAASAEKELAVIEDPDERAEFMEMLGVSEIRREAMLQACYDTLGQTSFFTVGEDEVRSWTIPRGCPAVEAAGQVHSDIARGFIRAEIVSYDDYIDAGSLKNAKAKNTMRLEGKDYPVVDGDIINFRFSV